MRKTADISIGFIIAIMILMLASCKSGVNLFKPAFPHEAYRNKLVKSGLDKTAMGTSWINAASESLSKSLEISIPFKQTGYFSAEKIPAAAYRFSALRGQKISINLAKKPIDGFMIYLDVFEQDPTGRTSRLTSADTLNNPVVIDVDENAMYVVRLQPELLKSGQYTLEINSGPSLEFPIKTTRENPIQSFWGDGRDAGARKHEGVDIFAPRGTPVLAVAEGRVVRVNENNLGGRVVWMRPDGKNYTVYYAHLDEQIATDGQLVKPGDTLGLMGNTGNARTTAPHLHFGIYTSEGAVDPLPFINPTIKPLPAISASLANLNATMRRTTGEIVYVSAAHKGLYRAENPDGTLDFIPSGQLSPVTKPIRKITIKNSQASVYDSPDSLAAVKTTLKTNETVEVIGNFAGYHLVRDQQNQTGWISK
jgi:murein DD-endopeptidase MepM/ murein hydrolase activator NlpD